MKHSDVTISLITHSATEECKRTLSAVLDSREGAQLILTSNGNEEIANHFDHIAKQREGVRTIFNSANEGFIAPSNWAFTLCETPFFVALNDDALPPSNWLDKLKEAIAPERVLVSGPGDRWLDPNFIGHKWRGGLPMQPDFIEFSCAMVKADAVKALGDPLFWPELKIAYGEDADTCLRLRSLGYEIGVADFAIQHRGGTTTRTVPQLHDIMRENFSKCRTKWAGYLKTRKL